MKTFYWYDLETFGINPRFDRIAQFAGIRTDENLNPVGEPDMFYCQLPPDYLPDSESCLVTGITPQRCQEQGKVEVTFAAKIHEIFSQDKSCVVGYNNIRFDDEFVRSLFYRNLYDPYQREYMNGNSRWDILDLIRACYALRSDGFKWPLRDDGMPSFRLQHLTEANGLLHQSAHDALSDVEATIQMARLVKEQQPKLFDFALKLRDKNTVRSMLNWQLLQPVVHISGKIPASRGCLSVFVPLAMHPNNKNGVICYDLAFAPDDLLSLSVEDIQDRIYTPQADLPEGVERIHLKTIHLNKVPFIAPLSVLKGTDLSRIGLDYAACQQHLQQIKGQSDGLSRKAAAVFNRPYELSSEDVDEMIYSGFFSYQDRAELEAYREARPADIPWGHSGLEDSRADELLKRYKARNFPECLTQSEQQQWQQEMMIRLDVQYGKHWNKWFESLKLSRNTHENGEAQLLLDELEQYVVGLMRNQ